MANPLVELGVDDMAKPLVEIGMYTTSRYTPTVSITANGYCPSVGDIILINDIQHMVDHIYGGGNTFTTTQFGPPDSYNVLSIPIDYTHPKKTKQKGKRFKPTVADRLAQARNAKFGG